MTNNPTHCLLLDWKQVFDAIDHTAMLHVLRRFGLSNKMLEIIEPIGWLTIVRDLYLRPPSSRTLFRRTPIRYPYYRKLP